jgi:hypothetical protein
VEVRPMVGRSGDCETRRVGLSGAVASLVSPCRS